MRPLNHLNRPGTPSARWDWLVDYSLPEGQGEILEIILESECTIPGMA